MDTVYNSPCLLGVLETWWIAHPSVPAGTVAPKILYILRKSGSSKWFSGARFILALCRVATRSRSSLGEKGNAWHFGYKAHTGVDRKTGLVLHLEVTSANVHDVTVVPKLISGEGTEVYGDSGYLGAEKREDAITHNSQGRKIHHKTNRRPSQSKNRSIRSRHKLSAANTRNHPSEQRLSMSLPLSKDCSDIARRAYRGLQKQTAKLNMLVALENSLSG